MDPSLVIIINIPEWKDVWVEESEIPSGLQTMLSLNKPFMTKSEKVIIAPNETRLILLEVYFYKSIGLERLVRVSLSLSV